jgi:hypothetical protein
VFFPYNRGVAERTERLDSRLTASSRKLSARDWKRFLEVLDDDTVAPALARAAKRYRKRTSK